jgi:preprotein translocase subunit SecY
MLFSLGVMPYISASIIFSLLTKVVPQLEKSPRKAPVRQRKINRYTRLATVPICIVQASFILFGRLMPSESGPNLLHQSVAEHFLLYAILVILSLTAGTLFIMWLGEQITEHGVGNGVSLIIMAGIVAGLWPAFSSYFMSDEGLSGVWQTLLLFLFAWAFAVVAASSS